MPSTQISDIIDPEILTQQVSARFPDKIRLAEAGAVQLSSDIAGIQRGGTMVKIPRWNRIGDFERKIEGSGFSVQKIDAVEELGVVVRRGAAYGVEDSASLVSLADPMAEIAAQIAEKAAREVHDTLINVLVGATPVGNTSDQAAATGTKVNITGDIVRDALIRLGDQFEDLAAVVMHSHVFFDAHKAGLITYADQGEDATSLNLRMGQQPYLFGRPVFVSDKVLLDTAGDNHVYDTYFLGRGALMVAYQRDLLVEVDRDILVKEDVISADVHYVPHLLGVGWNVATTNPANTDLATDTNWALKVQEARSVKAVRLTTNSDFAVGE